MYKIIMTNSSTERETFIVQNITLGWHSVSDIGLLFAPTEVKDLTWEDENVIRRSRNLKDSIRNGILRKLSPEEYEKTMEMQYQKEKKQLLREQQNKTKLNKLKTDDKEFDVDTIDLEKGKRKNSELDISGSASHPMSYVTAYEIASRLSDERGEVLTAEEFAEIVENDPGIVPKLLSRTKTAATEKNHNVYYAVPTNDTSNSVGVVQAKMTNLNRDARIDSGIDSEEVAMKADLLRDVVGYDDIVESNNYDMGIDESDEDFAEAIVLDSEE